MGRVPVSRCGAATAAIGRASGGPFEAKARAVSDGMIKSAQLMLIEAAGGNTEFPHLEAVQGWLLRRGVG